MVLKGKPNGRIVTCEFPEFPDGILYTCQDNAWMDKKVMLQSVEKILKPYVDDVLDGVIPILFLDSYRCHIMGSVVTAIQNLGVEVEHIPGGCTYLCQPVDVGVNKPFKKLIRDKWEQWMISEGIVHGTTSPRQGNKLLSGRCMQRAVSIRKLFKTCGAMVHTLGFLWISTTTTMTMTTMTMTTTIIDM